MPRSEWVPKPVLLVNEKPSSQHSRPALLSGPVTPVVAGPDSAERAAIQADTTKSRVGTAWLVDGAPVVVGGVGFCRANSPTSTPIPPNTTAPATMMGTSHGRVCGLVGNVPRTRWGNVASRHAGEPSAAVRARRSSCRRLRDIIRPGAGPRRRCRQQRALCCAAQRPAAAVAVVGLDGHPPGNHVVKRGRHRGLIALGRGRGADK